MTGIQINKPACTIPQVINPENTFQAVHVDIRKWNQIPVPAITGIVRNGYKSAREPLVDCLAVIVHFHLLFSDEIFITRNRYPS